MWGILLGMPLAVIIFLATDHYVMQWDLVGDRFAVDALAACLGLCGYYVARGIDVFLNQKRDNPPPFDVGKPLPEVFGTIKQALSEGMYGPFSWNLKTVDPDETRILGILNFTEMFGTGVLIPPTQAQRRVVLQVLVDPIPEAEQTPMISILPDGEKRQTRVTFTWLVDSPLGRVSVNRLQDEMTHAIKVALGVAAGEKPKPKSPFEPPEWVAVLTFLAFLLCFTQAEKYEDYKKQAAEERKVRQEQLAKEQAEREEAARKAAEEQAKRDAYNKEMEEKFKQAQEEQRRKADELLEQQRQQYNNQYSPYSSTPYTPSPNPFTPRLDQSDGFFSNRKYTSPFTTPLSPGQSDQGGTTGTTPWRSRFGGNQ